MLRSLRQHQPSSYWLDVVFTECPSYLTPHHVPATGGGRILVLFTPESHLSSSLLEDILKYLLWTPNYFYFSCTVKPSLIRFRGTYLFPPRSTQLWRQNTCRSWRGKNRIHEQSFSINPLFAVGLDGSCSLDSFSFQCRKVLILANICNSSRSSNLLQIIRN